MKRRVLCTTCTAEQLTDAAIQDLDAERSTGFLRERARCDECDRVLVRGALVYAWTIYEDIDPTIDDDERSFWESSIIEEGGRV